MTRTTRILKFAAVVGAVWLTGAADWPLSDVLAFLGDAGCC